MSKKIEIPEEVVDQKAYIKYTVLMNNPILKNRIIDLSDGGEVNIGLLPHVFKKKIEHLPPKEQEVLLERKQDYMRLLQKKNIALAQAYGNSGLRPH